jgi:hypothetical protein
VFAKLSRQSKTEPDFAHPNDDSGATDRYSKEGDEKNSFGIFE